MTSPQRVLVVCPGRGSYAADELGYLARRGALTGAAKIVEQLVEPLDAYRRDAGLPTLTELDRAARFSAARHLVGPNAGPLIYACSAADFALLDPERLNVVGIVGNSMGWYTATALGGALSLADGFDLVSTMSSSQQDGLIGGQLILPWVDETWRPDAARLDAVDRAIDDARLEGGEAFVSIRLGGYLVLAGDDLGLRLLEERLPKTTVGRREYPFRLAFHAAFHSPLMGAASEFGRERCRNLNWRRPSRWLVDGSGRLYSPLSTRTTALADYTFGEQVLATYDFTQSLRTALRELQPERIVLLGPGDSLGGAIGQTLVLEGWEGLRSKADFVTRQGGEDPILIALGRSDDFNRFVIKQ